MILDINNLYLYSTSSMISQNCLLYISEYNIATLNIFCINNNNKYIYKYANEYLYLINYSYPNNFYYYNYINIYNTIIHDNMKQVININENVLQLFTTFSRGSVHGFSGFYYTLIEYITNFNKYKDLKLLFYKESDNGMLDIINFLCEKNIIDKSRIIYIEKNTYYEFLSITFIPNNFHCFVEELIPIVNKFIENYLITEKSYVKDNICLLKTKNTTHFSSAGLFTISAVDNFTKKYSFNKINTDNEIELINRIYNCSILLISYGSCFFKNFIYISEKCKKVIVLIKGNSELNDIHYITDYKNLCETNSPYQGTILKKYKNADFIYKIIDNDDELNFNPFE
jgi:hypothetical protein